MDVKTEDFVYLLFAILGAFPPDSKFCKIVKALAESDAWDDFMEKEYAPKGEEDYWERDQQTLITELKDKFGDEIDMEEIIEEWKKQVEK
ncbi:hypothetical protein [Floridanema evergladense]|uniref:Uncharacterized protein n=1 Tax=Floridaenema evergladense BLCC-F167 TaxID=3153639 RepID=A0ABV4WVH8_9CYAN